MWQRGDALRNERSGPFLGHSVCWQRRTKIGNMAKRILITGATGFVGRRLVSRLVEEGWHLTLTVRTSGTAAAWRRDNLRIIETGPLEQSQNLDLALADVSSVVHLAGLAHRGDASETDFMRANAEATSQLADAAAANGVSAFIHLSSLAAVTENAASETVNDNTNHEPTTPYGSSKRLAEQHVLTLPARGIFAISLRPPLIVGAEAKGNWAALQRLAATGFPLPFGGVNNRRSMIGIDTLVEAIVYLCSKTWPIEKSGNYCIADPESLSLAEVVAELRKGMGLSPRLFSVPDVILRTAANRVLKRRAAGLLGSLEVDAHRFAKQFDFPLKPRLREDIRRSGQEYRQLRQAEKATPT